LSFVKLRAINYMKSALKFGFQISDFRLASERHATVYLSSPERAGRFSRGRVGLRRPGGGDSSNRATTLHSDSNRRGHSCDKKRRRPQAYRAANADAEDSAQPVT